MTAAMDWMHRRLPADQRGPLPPRLITDQLLQAAGVRSLLSRQSERELALLAHFAYGAAAGAAYALLRAPRGGAQLGRGTSYALAVWAASYLGWLPATGLLQPATRHRPRRAGLMIAAHLVWGACTELLCAALERAPGASRPKFPSPDAPRERPARRGAAP